MTSGLPPAVLAHLRANAPALADGTIDYERLLDDYRGRFDFYDSRRHLATVPGADLAAAARARAAALASFGLRRGDRVVMVAANDQRYLTTLLGVLLVGAVPCAVAAPPTPSRPGSAGVRHLQAAVRAVEPELLIGPAAAAVTAAGVAPLDYDEITRMAQTAAGQTLPDPATPARAADIHHIQLTSGSTSDPKAVLLTHAAVAHNLGALGAAMGVRPGAERVFSWLPMYHDMGFIQVLSGLAHRAAVAMMSPFSFLRDPLSWARHMTHHGSTVTAGPTFAYRAAAESLARDPRGGQGVDLSALRHAFVGAEPIAYETLRRFADGFAPLGLRPDALVPCYGMAESVLATTLALRPAPQGPGNLGRVRVAPAPDGRAPLVSCGRPIDGMTVSVVDDAGLPVPPGVIGDIRIAGCSLMAGYRGGRTAGAEPGEGGGHDTGDRGFLSDGELFVTGRREEMLIIRGRNLPPYDVEQAIGELPEVGPGQAAVFCAPDDGRGRELIVAVIGTGAADPDLVRAAAAARVRDVFGIGLDEVVVLPRRGIPRTTSGKIRRLALRERYLSGEGLAVRCPAP